MPPAETVHPILKHPREEGSPSKALAANKVGSVGNTKSDKSRHLTWDEHAIEEHDLLRGTRMKVRLLNNLLSELIISVSGHLSIIFHADTYLMFICKY
jgi:hypothetical protein